MVGTFLVFFLGSGIADVRVPAEFSAEARFDLFTQRGISLEQDSVAWDVVATRAALLRDPEAFTLEEYGAPGLPHENALQERPGIVFLGDPRSQNNPEGSLSTNPSALLESLGTPLARSFFLGIRLDLLGSDEFDGWSPAKIDARQGTLRVNNLSTGIGLTIKF